MGRGNDALSVSKASAHAESAAAADLPGRTVRFTGRTGELCRGLTDGDGRVSCGTLTDQQVVAAAGFRATFDGDDAYGKVGRDGTVVAVR